MIVMDSKTKPAAEIRQRIGMPDRLSHLGKSPEPCRAGDEPANRSNG